MWHSGGYGCIHFSALDIPISIYSSFIVAAMDFSVSYILGYSSMFRFRYISVFYTFAEYPLYICWISSIYLLNILYTFAEYFVHIPWIFLKLCAGQCGCGSVARVCLLLECHCVPHHDGKMLRPRATIHCYTGVLYYILTLGCCNTLLNATMGSYITLLHWVPILHCYIGLL